MSPASYRLRAASLLKQRQPLPPPYRARKQRGGLTMQAAPKRRQCRDAVQPLPSRYDPVRQWRLSSIQLSLLSDRLNSRPVEVARLRCAPESPALAT